MSDIRLEAPSAVLAALEYRAIGERIQFSAVRPALKHLPRGDGHAVIVLPGFTASDRSTEPLRRLLRDLGYRSHGWRQGRNLGPTPDVISGLWRRIDDLSSRYDDQLSLVGWSLGGIFAREVARAMPDRFRQVITLGSPIQMLPHDRSGASPMWDLVRRFHAPGRRRTVREAMRPPLEVPATSIYSRTDGVVAWRASVIEETPISENIRVHGSHCGLGHNVAVMVAIADRLAQPAGEWERFEAPWWMRSAFPYPDPFDLDALTGAA